MSALPSGTNALYCNKNSTAARTFMTQTLTYFDKNDVKNGMTSLNNMMKLTDEIANHCYYGIEEQITVNFLALIGLPMLENVLYNAGYMFTDVLTIITADPENTVNYPYVLSSNIGDFLMRFIYRDTKAQ